MKRYFGYIRVSTPKQGQGVSLQEQREAILAHAARHDLTIVEWFEEKETAAKEGRNVFTHMLGQLERGKAEGVVIHKIDRSARNLWDWANLGKLFDRGIDVQFAHDSIDLRSRGGRLSADIMAVVAADYVRNLRDEVKKGFYGRLKQGVYPLPAPIGYLDRGAGKPKEIDPVVGPAIKWAFEQYATGTIGVIELSAELERRGVRSRQGTRISLNGISTILHNPFYIGLIRIKRTKEVFQGAHTPLVTKRVFDAVQDVLRGKAPKNVFAREFTFRRFARCHACHRYLTCERKKARYVYYRCYNPRCRSSVVRERDIDNTLAAIAAQIVLSPKEIGDLRDLANKAMEQTQHDNTQRLSGVQMRIAKCDERVSRLTDALVDGLIDKETYESRKCALLNERRELLDMLDDPKNAASIPEQILNYLELPDVLQLRYKTAKPDEKRDFGLAVAWNFSVRGKKPVPTLKSPYREIVSWRKSLTVDRVVEPLELSTKKLYGALRLAARIECSQLRSPQCP